MEESQNLHHDEYLSRSESSVSPDTEPSEIASDYDDLVIPDEFEQELVSNLFTKFCQQQKNSSQESDIHGELMQLINTMEQNDIPSYDVQCQQTAAHTETALASKYVEKNTSSQYQHCSHDLLHMTQRQLDEYVQTAKHNQMYYEQMAAQWGYSAMQAESLQRVRNLESKAFAGYRRLRDNDLDTLQFGQLEYIIYKLFGLTALYTYYQWTVDVFSRVVPDVNGNSKYLTDTEYYNVLLKYIKDRSCRYCHYINHTTEKCMKLQKKKCQWCQCHGHDAHHCVAYKCIAKQLPQHLKLY